MKKILFVFRDSYDSQYILQKLFDTFAKSKTEYCFSIIIETGKTAIIHKLKRMFAKTKIYTYPYMAINIFSLICYSTIITYKMKKKLGLYTYPCNVIMHTDSINNRECIKNINESDYDCIFIYGTAIVRQTTLQQINRPIYNIHCSILPYYRNVHSDFWAYIQNRHDTIGVTIIKLDSGIDTGDILIQEKATITNLMNLVDIKVENLKLIVKLLNLVIPMNIENPELLSFSRQNDTLATYSQTPTVLNIFSYIQYEFSRKKLLKQVKP